jgi:hypothetical protein
MHVFDFGAKTEYLDIPDMATFLQAKRLHIG